LVRLEFRILEIPQKIENRKQLHTNSEATSLKTLNRLRLNQLDNTTVAQSHNRQTTSKKNTRVLELKTRRAHIDTKWLIAEFGKEEGRMMTRLRALTIATEHKIFILIFTMFQYFVRSQKLKRYAFSLFSRRSGRFHKS
jgi:hypothetical protein